MDFGDALIGSTVTSLNRIPIPGLELIQFWQCLLQSGLVGHLSYVLVAGLWFMLFHTNWGLQIRSVGEAPIVCDALGLSVAKIATCV